MRWSRGGGLRAAGAIAATVGAFVCAVPAAATPGALQIAGTPGDDQIAIDATSADTGSYSVNGGPAQMFAAATKVTVDAGAGNDSVVVNNPTGGLFAPTLGIVVNGGGGSDHVTSQNGLAATGSYTLAFGSTPARLVQIGAAKQVITFNGVQGVKDVNTDARFAYKATPAHDDVLVDDYPEYPVSSRIISAGSSNFGFSGKSSMTVDTLGTDSTPDTVKLTGHSPVPQLAIDDGSQPAEDVITAQDFRLGGLDIANDSLVLHGSRIEGLPSSNQADVTAVTVALDGGTVGTTAAPLGVETNKLDAQTQGDAQIRIKALNFTSDLQLGGVRKPVGGGVRSASGSVWIAHDGSAPLTSLAQDAAVSGQSVYLRSDRLDLSKGHVDAGGGGAILLPGDPWPIDLGATNDDWGSLNLSAAEVANIRTQALTIGQATGGLVTASDAIARRSTEGLMLVSGTGFTATGSGMLSAGKLSLIDGSATGRSWLVDPSRVSVDGRAPVPYGSTPALTLHGGSGADTFAVKPSPLTAYAIDGGEPSTSPGDSLAYDAGGRTVSGDTSPPDGEIDATGVKPVTFTGIEGVSIANSGP